VSEKCPNCIALEARVAKLEALVAEQAALISRQAALIASQATQIAKQEMLIKELQARLNSNSSNSHRPPSSDPPGQTRLPSGRPTKPRKGRPGIFRSPFSEEEITEFLVCQPRVCKCCGGQLALGSVVGHRTFQQVDLPVIKPVLREIHGIQVQCQTCRKITTGVPPQGLGTSFVGPRLVAFLGYLNGRMHLTTRNMQELIVSMLGPKAHLSLGLISNCRVELSKALATSAEMIAQGISAAPAIWADETGWSQWGKRAWLWVASSEQATLFRLDPSRGGKALTKLLGNFNGFLTSDRWCGYSRIPNQARQLCFSHLKRDFQALIDRRLGAEKLGKWGKSELAKAFRLWNAFRSHLLSRGEFEFMMRAIRARFKRLLRQCLKSPDQKAVAIGKYLRKHWPAMWAFVRNPELLEPTNNRAERMLRQAVIWRKISQGSKSERGMTCAQRFLSVMTTLRQQGRDILDFLISAVRTFNKGLSPPPMFPAVAG
jgi:transposase